MRYGRLRDMLRGTDMRRKKYCYVSIWTWYISLSTEELIVDTFLSDNYIYTFNVSIFIIFDKLDFT